MPMNPVTALQNKLSGQLDWNDWVSPLSVMPPLSRLLEAGSKPPQAAVIKSAERQNTSTLLGASVLSLTIGRY